MITFILEMGEQRWVPLPLCFPAAARFLEAVCLSLDIRIIVGIFFTIATKSSLVAASLALLATSCSSTDFCWWQRRRGCQIILLEPSCPTFCRRCPSPAILENPLGRIRGAKLVRPSYSLCFDSRLSVRPLVTGFLVGPGFWSSA